MFLLGRPIFRGELLVSGRAPSSGQDHLLEKFPQPGMASDVAVGSNWVVGGLIQTVDGSEIPNNHLVCMKPCK